MEHQDPFTVQRWPEKAWFVAGIVPERKVLVYGIRLAAVQTNVDSSEQIADYYGSIPGAAPITVHKVRRHWDIDTMVGGDEPNAFGAAVFAYRELALDYARYLTAAMKDEYDDTQGEE